VIGTIFVDWIVAPWSIALGGATSPGTPHSFIGRSGNRSADDHARTSGPITADDSRSPIPALGAHRSMLRQSGSVVPPRTITARHSEPHGLFASLRIRRIRCVIACGFRSKNA